MYGLTGSADPAGKRYLQDIPAYSNPHLKFNAIGFLRRCIKLRKSIWPNEGRFYDLLFPRDYKYGEHFFSFCRITQNMNMGHPGNLVHPNSHGNGIHPDMHQYYHGINIFWQPIKPDPPHDSDAFPWRGHAADTSE